jgi:hypothetical protein
VGLGNNLGGNVEVFSEVGETLVGEGVVVPLPRELGLDESLGGEGLHGLDDFEVSDSHVGVLGSVKVLGSDEDTLLEEVLVDLEVSTGDGGDELEPSRQLLLLICRQTRELST